MTLYEMPSVVYRGNDLAWHRHQWKHHASYLMIVQRQVDVVAHVMVVVAWQYISE